MYDFNIVEKDQNMNIVFLGDSITDAGKSENACVSNAIGQGYAMIISAKLGKDQPKQHRFVNAGISGDRCVDAFARIKSDCWNHTPDLVSVLLGVNDVWHELLFQNGVNAKRFEAVMRMMLQDTIEAFPDVKYIFMEPYLLPGEASEGKFETFSHEVQLRAKVVKKLAVEFSAPFVPLQEIFDEACKLAPASYWAWDGVHATPAGHQLIAEAWLRAFEML